jgi:hypothetical protein
MLHGWEGRLKWLKTPQGVLVEIPRRPNGMMIVYVPLIVGWLTYAAIHYFHVLGMPHPEDAQFKLQMIALGIYAVGFCYFICWLIWVLTNDTVLTADPNEIKIQRRVLGVEVATRTYRTKDARKLRFVPASKFWANRRVLDPKSSKVQFQINGRTHIVARGISEAEANALMVQMLSVHRFAD